MNVNVMFHNKCLGDVALTSPLTYKAKLSFYIRLLYCPYTSYCNVKGLWVVAKALWYVAMQLLGCSGWFLWCFWVVAYWTWKNTFMCWSMDIIYSVYTGFEWFGYSKTLLIWTFYSSFMTNKITFPQIYIFIYWAAQLFSTLIIIRNVSWAARR